MCVDADAERRDTSYSQPHCQFDCSSSWQAGAESIMRNVAKRMQNGEIAAAVIIWRENQVLEERERLARERGERIMKRVGGRWANRDLSDKFREWMWSWQEERDRLRAEAIMRRVGGRWRNQELAMNWTEYVTNYRGDIITMWRNRTNRLQLSIDELEMKFRLVTQVLMNHKTVL